jgi:hypothetical protein
MYMRRANKVFDPLADAAREAAGAAAGGEAADTTRFRRGVFDAEPAPQEKEVPHR